MPQLRTLEGSVLSKIPGYEYLKQAGTSVLGVSESAEHPVVLARLGGVWRIGVQAWMKIKCASAIMVPDAVVTLEAIPQLGSGKTDYIALSRLLRERVA